MVSGPKNIRAKRNRKIYRVLLATEDVIKVVRKVTMQESS